MPRLGTCRPASILQIKVSYSGRGIQSAEVSSPNGAARPSKAHAATQPQMHCGQKFADLRVPLKWTHLSDKDTQQSVWKIFENPVCGNEMVTNRRAARPSHGTSWSVSLNLLRKIAG
jgi:hypothetical protein